MFLLSIAKHDEFSVKMKKTQKENVNRKDEQVTDMSYGERKERVKVRNEDGKFV